MDTTKITTIKLKGDTKSLLDKLKLIERESYDEVIQRLIQSFSKEQSETSSEEQSGSDSQKQSEASSGEQLEAGFEKQPEASSEEQPEKSFESREIVPEPMQSVKEEKVRLLKSILGSITDDEKKVEGKGSKEEEKKKVKISSRFEY